MFAWLGAKRVLRVLEAGVLAVFLDPGGGAAPGTSLTASLWVGPKLGHEVGRLLDDGAARRASTSVDEFLADGGVPSEVLSVGGRPGGLSRGPLFEFPVPRREFAQAMARVSLDRGICEGRLVGAWRAASGTPPLGLKTPPRRVRGVMGLSAPVSNPLELGGLPRRSAADDLDELAPLGE